MANAMMTIVPSIWLAGGATYLMVHMYGDLFSMPYISQAVWELAFIVATPFAFQTGSKSAGRPHEKHLLAKSDKGLA